jgi:DNA-binding transcriptional MerR regulator
VTPIRQASAGVGVSPDTLGYYERVGLLAPPERSSNGYRVYDDATTERVRLIKGAQRLGLRLDAIRELLALLDPGACPCGHSREYAEQRVAEIDTEIHRLNGSGMTSSRWRTASTSARQHRLGSAGARPS